MLHMLFYPSIFLDSIQSALTANDIDNRLLTWNDSIASIEKRLCDNTCDHLCPIEVHVDYGLRCQFLQHALFRAFKTLLPLILPVGRLALVHLTKQNSLYATQHPCYAVVLTEPPTCTKDDPVTDDNVFVWLLVVLPHGAKPLDITPGLSTASSAALPPPPPAGLKVLKRKDDDEEFMYGSKGKGGKGGSKAPAAPTFVPTVQSGICSVDGEDRAYLITKTSLQHLTIVLNKKSKVPTSNTAADITTSVQGILSAAKDAEALEVSKELKQKSMDLVLADQQRELSVTTRLFLTCKCIA